MIKTRDNHLKRDAERNAERDDHRDEVRDVLSCPYVIGGLSRLNVMVKCHGHRIHNFQ